MKMIQKTFSFRLKPTKEQLILFAKFAGSTRYIFNYGLALIKEAMEGKQKVPTYTDIANKLPYLKRSTETAWLKEIHSQVLQHSLKNLESAFKHFFRRLKNKEKPGFPRFKKKGDNDSFRYPQGVSCGNAKVYLPKIGWVAYRDSRLIEGIIKQATIKREGKHWNIHIVCEIEIDIQKVSVSEKKAIGIDLGIKNFAYLSDGQVIENQKILNTYLKKLAFLQRHYAHKKKGSNNQKKIAVKVAKVHRLIKNIRKDFHHKLSTNIAKNHGVVAVENLNIKGMVLNRRLSRAIADAGWCGFVNYLEYKCIWLGKNFVKVGRFLPSSKQCSSCGNVQNISLQTRVYTCGNCGLQLDRDLNASLNIRAAGLSAFKACGELSIS
ncbi:MAG: RNA-guided endonuclease InsQ/TnpB family protein [Candidatus Babeliales bacterium]